MSPCVVSVLTVSVSDSASQERFPDLPSRDLVKQCLFTRNSDLTVLFCWLGFLDIDCVAVEQSIHDVDLANPFAGYRNLIPAYTRPIHCKQVINQRTSCSCQQTNQPIWSVSRRTSCVIIRGPVTLTSSTDSWIHATVNWYWLQKGDLFAGGRQQMLLPTIDKQ